ncbi:TonB family protein [Teredinibacter sp. KSP-S5-2]|uniref:TonB family protein n=1 Tax=Teredinibacter sp. KSP-S5-2 TaxID=3034506 RepID=UPI002934EFFC|nr:TonB family protein [Teredinibacter sp. KSP-S5-2]WNO11279.1 TonB family protein [Teredinibacter sp. KSP-S5-2]
MNKVLILVLFLPITVLATKVAPYYPKEALEACVEGYAVLSFEVPSEGIVSNIQVVESYPEGVFGEAAIKNLEKSVSVYANKEAVGKRHEEKFTFEIEGECE